MWYRPALEKEGSLEKTYEYKFTIGNWAAQEEFTEGTSCTSTIDGYTNRTLDVSKDTRHS